MFKWIYKNESKNLSFKSLNHLKHYDYFDLSYEMNRLCQSSPQNPYTGSHFIQNESQSPSHGL